MWEKVYKDVDSLCVKELLFVTFKHVMTHNCIHNNMCCEILATVRLSLSCNVWENNGRTTRLTNNEGN